MVAAVSTSSSRCGLQEPVVVTGATGFIGRRLVKRLLDDGCRPRALVLAGDTVPVTWDRHVDVERGDVAHPGDVARAMRDAATVFHLAALVSDWGDDAAHQRVTVRGTENVLGEAARQGARAVLASSVVVYGDRVGREVCEEHLPMGRPLGPYSRSKQEQERIAHHLEALAGLKVTIVRPTNVYGAGSVPWVDRVIEQLEAKRPALVDKGTGVAALIHVDDVVDVFVRAAMTPAAVGRVYNASDDSAITWGRYFRDLAGLAGAPPPKAIAHWAARAAARGGEILWSALGRSDPPPLTREALNLVGSHLRVPIDRARSELGYQPRVSYEAALREIADYLRRR
jgi:nucleoside-diphosphate-sugar epimerase